MNRDSVFVEIQSGQVVISMVYIVLLLLDLYSTIFVAAATLVEFVDIDCLLQLC